jgi:MOSC domain-containing protein YiiM
VGDVFRIGGARVQVSQPRMPCSKLAGKNGSKMLPKLIAIVGYTGFYMRVLSEGVVAAGESFDLERAHPERITIAEVNGIIYEKSYDVAGVLGGRSHHVCSTAGASSTELTT